MGALKLEQDTNKWSFKQILFILGLMIGGVAGVVLWIINVQKPVNGLGPGLISAALLIVGGGLVIIALLLYIIDWF